MADTPAAPIVPVQFNEDAIAEDLTHHPPVARKALDLFRREIDRDGGLSFSRLKRCEDEGRDGTQTLYVEPSARHLPSGPIGKHRVYVQDPARLHLPNTRH